jgi:hypothetical protein
VNAPLGFCERASLLAALLVCGLTNQAALHLVHFVLLSAKTQCNAPSVHAYTILRCSILALYCSCTCRLILMALATEWRCTVVLPTSITIEPVTSTCCYKQGMQTNSNIRHAMAVQGTDAGYTQRSTIGCQLHDRYSRSLSLCQCERVCVCTRGLAVMRVSAYSFSSSPSSLSASAAAAAPAPAAFFFLFFFFLLPMPPLIFCTN